MRMPLDQSTGPRIENFIWICGDTYRSVWQTLGRTSLAGNQQKAFLSLEEKQMGFFNSVIGVLQTLVIALGAGLGIWGAINLMEGYGNDNPGANAHVR